MASIIFKLYYVICRVYLFSLFNADHRMYMRKHLPFFKNVGIKVKGFPRFIDIAENKIKENNPEFYRKEKVIVKENSFAGVNCIILHVIRIGKSVVVGKVSVVTKDVLSNTIIAGNSKKQVKSIKDHVTLRFELLIQ